MNREGPPIKTPKVITIEEARRIADATFESAKRERRESFERESREYLASQSFDLYVVIEHFHPNGFYSNKVIGIFNDEKITKEYIKKNAIKRLDKRKKYWQKLSDDGRFFDLCMGHILELKEVSFIWDRDEYRSSINGEPYDDFSSYTIKNIELNREYTMEEIDEELNK